MLDEPFKLETALEVSFRHVAIRDRIATVVYVTEREGGWHIDCKRKMSNWRKKRPEHLHPPQPTKPFQKAVVILS